MDTMTSPWRRAGVVLALAALLAAAVPAFAARQASALGPPGDPPQLPRYAQCQTDTIQITTADGWVPLVDPTLYLFPAHAGSHLVSVSADVRVESGAELRIGYRYNYGSVQERFYGPASFASATPTLETRSTTAVVGHNASSFRFQPMVRVHGTSGKTAALSMRCATATTVPPIWS